MDKKPLFLCGFIMTMAIMGAGPFCIAQTTPVQSAESQCRNQRYGLQRRLIDVEVSIKAAQESGREYSSQQQFYQQKVAGIQAQMKQLEARRNEARQQLAALQAPTKPTAPSPVAATPKQFGDVPADVDAKLKMVYSKIDTSKLPPEAAQAINARKAALTNLPPAPTDPKSPTYKQQMAARQKAVLQSNVDAYRDQVRRAEQTVSHYERMPVNSAEEAQYRQFRLATARQELANERQFLAKAQAELASLTGQPPQIGPKDKPQSAADKAALAERLRAEIQGAEQQLFELQKELVHNQSYLDTTNKVLGQINGRLQGYQQEVSQLKPQIDALKGQCP